MPLRVAIVGGGLGGLTLAAALSQLCRDNEDIEVDIYEAAAAFSQVGAGITLWPRAWDIYRKMGLEDDLKGNLSAGQKPPSDEPRLNFSFRKSDTPTGVPIFDLTFAGAAVFIHRSILLDLLLRRISKRFRHHLSHRLSSYAEEADGTISLTFENGVSATCDVLVGADGIKSNVRKYFLGTHPGPTPAPPEVCDPIWSGTFAFRCMIDKSAVAKRLPSHRVLNTPMIYCGKGKHIVAYPMPELNSINIIAYTSDPMLEGTPYHGPSFTDVSTEEIIPVYAGWEEEVVVIAEHMTKASRWAIHSLRPLEKYAQGRVFLVGDAAHAMTPHQGNGAGQAIEDGFVLAHCLHTVQSHDIPIEEASKVYNAIRQPFGNFVLDASRNHGLLYQFNDPEFADVTPGDDTLGPERLERFAAKVKGDWEYAWSTYVDDDLEKTLTMLKG